MQSFPNLDTPMGKIATFIGEGVQLGVLHAEWEDR